MTQNSIDQYNQRKLLESANRIIVKVGTAVSCQGEEWWRAFANELKKFGTSKRRFVLIVSGAREFGNRQLQTESIQAGMDEERHHKTYCCRGQTSLTALTVSILADVGIDAAQLLVRYSDVVSTEENVAITTLLDDLVTSGAMPILNEDNFSGKGIKKDWDNDQLTAWVAKLWKADLVVFLTDIAGVFDADPQHVATATLLRNPSISDLKKMRFHASEQPTKYGRGGMASKARAASTIASNGMASVIMNGIEIRPLLRLSSGVNCTVVLPLSKQSVRATQPFENGEFA